MVTDPELAEAWALPRHHTRGLVVGTPGWEDRYEQWSQFAFDPSEPAVLGGRERQWMTVGQTELDCARSMAYCLADVKQWRWPK